MKLLLNATYETEEAILEIKVRLRIVLVFLLNEDLTVIEDSVIMRGNLNQRQLLPSSTGDSIFSTVDGERSCFKVLYLRNGAFSHI